MLKVMLETLDNHVVSIEQGCVHKSVIEQNQGDNTNPCQVSIEQGLCAYISY